MKKIQYFILLLWVVSIWACVKEENKESTPLSKCDLLQKDDYLIFGKFYGFCQGNCTTLFKMTPTELFADNIERYDFEKAITFDTNNLGNAKIEIAKTVCSSFVSEIKNEKSDRIGCPDCYDQGTIYFELKQNGKVQKWFIDPTISAQPAYLQSFAKAIEDATLKLK
jgi:hypothetical protein